MAYSTIVPTPPSFVHEPNPDELFFVTSNRAPVTQSIAQERVFDWGRDVSIAKPLAIRMSGKPKLSVDLSALSYCVLQIRVDKKQNSIRLDQPNGR